MLTPLRRCINTAHKNIARYRLQRVLTEEIAKRERRIKGLKAYIRTVDTSPTRTRAIERIKTLEIEISQRLAQLSALQLG